MWLSAQEQVLFLQRTQCDSQQLSQAAVCNASFGASDADTTNTFLHTCMQAKYPCKIKMKLKFMHWECIENLYWFWT